MKVGARVSVCLCVSVCEWFGMGGGNSLHASIFLFFCEWGRTEPLKRHQSNALGADSKCRLPHEIVLMGKR